MAVVRESVLTTSQNYENTALPTAVAQIIVKDFLDNVNILLDQGSQITLVSKDFVNKFNLKLDRGQLGTRKVEKAKFQ